MDNGYNPAYPGVHRAETLPVPEIQPAVYVPFPEAAQRVYERGSIAETLQRMFNEADQMPVSYWQPESEYVWDVHPTDTEAYQTVLHEIQDRLKHSGAVKNITRKVEAHESITASDVEAVFHYYEKTFREVVAKHKSTMTAKQMNVLKFQAQSELDYSFRDVLTQHLISGSENVLKSDPMDFFLLVNPKARKIDYMSSGEILSTLRHSMSIPTMSTDRLKHDLRAVESVSSRTDFEELTNSSEVTKLRNTL